MNATTVDNLEFDNKHNDALDITAKLYGFLVNFFQPTIGLAVVTVNGALLYFYKHSVKASKITLLFLKNLTTSDIIFGLLFCFRFVMVIAAPQYVEEACRYGMAPGSVISVIVSAWSILLISIQVDYLNEFPFNKLQGVNVFVLCHF